MGTTSVLSNVNGFLLLSRTIGTTLVIIQKEDPEKLGIVRLVVSLFIGAKGAIYMDHVLVQ